MKHDMTLNELIAIANEKGIDFNKPILWKRTHYTSEIDLYMSNHREGKKAWDMRYLGTISKMP